jgi:hypothetical protein
MKKNSAVECEVASFEESKRRFEPGCGNENRPYNLR